MTRPQDDRNLGQRMARLDVLLQEVEQLDHPRSQALTRELVQTLLDLHGAGLERILRHADQAMMDSLARDEVVRSLLLLHGLHPADTETRVRQALERVRPSLQAHGGTVELLGVEQGLIRLRVEGSRDGHSSALTLTKLIEEAIYDAAPEVVGIDTTTLEGVPDSAGSRLTLPLVSVR